MLFRQKEHTGVAEMFINETIIAGFYSTLGVVLAQHAQSSGFTHKTKLLIPPLEGREEEIQKSRISSGPEFEANLGYLRPCIYKANQKKGYKILIILLFL